MMLLTDFILPFTVWHWVVLGLILLSAEMLTGTFDMLFVGIASFAAAAYASIAPDAINGWGSQTVVFVIAAVGMIIGGRVFFARTQGDEFEHPTLNKRMKGLIGQRGTVEADFVGGSGRVCIGDTTWMAEAEDTSVTFAKGDIIEVTSAFETIVRVRAI